MRCGQRLAVLRHLFGAEQATAQRRFVVGRALNAPRIVATSSPCSPSRAGGQSGTHGSDLPPAAAAPAGAG